MHLLKIRSYPWAQILLSNPVPGHFSMYSEHALFLSGSVLIIAGQRMYHRSFAILYLLPTKMSMYYATLLIYGDRQRVRFDSGSNSSKADIRRIILKSTNPSQHPYRPLQKKLSYQSLLIPHPVGDEKHGPALPAPTIDGSEHWMLIQALLNPDEYQRLTAFL